MGDMPPPEQQEDRLSAEPAALLVEYQKAQDSAEHHDGRVANVTTLWVGTAVLMGFVLSALTTKGAVRDHWLVLVLLGAIGIFLTYTAWRWSERANALKRQKYDRCVEIEEKLGLWQHRDVKKPSRWQSEWAYRGLIFLFIAGWIGLLGDVLRERFSVTTAVVVSAALGLAAVVALAQDRPRQDSSEAAHSGHG